MEFAIVKDYVTFLGQTGVRYLQVFDPLKVHKELSRKEALALIKKHSMKKVADTEDGKIWDTPDLSWTNKYRGCYAAMTKEQRMRRRAAMMDNA